MKSFGDFNKGIKNQKYKFEIIPCPYEATVTYGSGTSRGPEAIIEASQELEFYDHEFKIKPYSLGIKTSEPLLVPLQNKETKEAFCELETRCLEVLSSSKVPIVLGGEHSLSLGPIRAAYRFLKSRGEDLTVLHFDAHADMREAYLGNPYSHASVMYQVFKHCPGIKIVSVGIRNFSEEEDSWIESLKTEQGDQNPIKIFFAHEQRDCLSKEGWNSDSIIKALKKMKNKNFYISFDVDGFDSAIMPSTGTPEPGGLTWYTVMKICRQAFSEFNLIGADFVELAPIKGFHGPDFLVAKLIYKIIGMKVLQLSQSQTKDPTKLVIKVK
jgi:agmatinase